MVAAQTVVNKLGKRLQEVLKKLSDVIEKYKEQQKEKCDLHCQLGEDLCFCFKCAPAVPPPPPPRWGVCIYTCTCIIVGYSVCTVVGYIYTLVYIIDTTVSVTRCFGLLLHLRLTKYPLYFVILFILLL